MIWKIAFRLSSHFGHLKPDANGRQNYPKNNNMCISSSTMLLFLLHPSPSPHPKIQLNLVGFPKLTIAKLLAAQDQRI